LVGASGIRVASISIIPCFVGVCVNNWGAKLTIVSGLFACDDGRNVIDGRSVLLNLVDSGIILAQAVLGCGWGYIANWLCSNPYGIVNAAVTWSNITAVNARAIVDWKCNISHRDTVGWVKNVSTCTVAVDDLSSGIVSALVARGEALLGLAYRCGYDDILACATLASDSGLVGRVGTSTSALLCAHLDNRWWVEEVFIVAVAWNRAVNWASITFASGYQGVSRANWLYLEELCFGHAAVARFSIHLVGIAIASAVIVCKIGECKVSKVSSLGWARASLLGWWVAGKRRAHTRLKVGCSSANWCHLNNLDVVRNTALAGFVSKVNICAIALAIALEY